MAGGRGSWGNRRTAGERAVTVILEGVRADGTPLVLVRCRCGVRWITRAFWVFGAVTCDGCGERLLDVRWPTLAEADRLSPAQRAA